MSSKSRQRIMFFLFWQIMLMYLVASCVSSGSSKVSRRNTDKIMNGKTTKEEAIKLLGEPEQIVKLDKEGLETYLNRVAVSDSPLPEFREGLYELLIYNRWNHAAVLVLTPSYEEAKMCIIVIDSEGVCVERFYARESSFRF